MAWLRQNLASLLLALFTFGIFFLALAAVSARTFLPGDMLAPAPIGLLGLGFGLLGFGSLG
jgi:hypothetical protein